MKFLEQANSLQNALLKRTRLFSTIMLISGIGLVAATPFMSYEAAQLDCYQKSQDVIVLTKTDTVILKKDISRKDTEINQLKRENDDLTKGLDCSDIIKDLETDRDILLENLATCDEQLAECLAGNDKVKELIEKIDALTEQNNQLKDRLDNCNNNEADEKLAELYEEINSLKGKINSLNLQLKSCGGETNNRETNNCDQLIGQYKDEIVRLEKEIETWTTRTTRYKKRWQKCESILEAAEKEAANGGEGNNKHVLFLEFSIRFGGQAFVIGKQDIQYKCPIGDRSQTGIYINNNRTNITGPGSYEFFQDSGKNYTLTLEDITEEGYVYVFSLTDEETK